MTAFLLLFILLLPGAPTFASIEDEAPIILREPAADEPIQELNPQATGRVSQLVDNKTLKAISHFNDWYMGEVVALESMTPSVGIVGFVEVVGIENKQDGTYEITCERMRQSRMNFIQVGDQIMHLDLTTDNARYVGTTDLIIKDSNKSISSKYKPLFTQGLTAGETAHTLWENEYLVTWYGQVSYGLKPWLTINTVVPANFLGALNASAKANLYDSVANTVSVGLGYATIPDKDRSTLNLNIYWDSISTETTVSHTLLSIALFSFEKAEDATAIKSLGTSSFQSGYEFILSHWDRVLLGPSFNVDKKSVGGYVSYVKIWDKFHLSLSLSSTDLAELKYAPDAYYLLFDAYWRF